MPGKPLKSSKSTTHLGKDRRANPRHKFVAPAKIADKNSGTKVETRVTDLAKQGCFVEATNPLPLGTIIILGVTKASKSIVAEARVVSSTPGKGMGLFFISMDTASRATLDEWLAKSLEASWLASTRRQRQWILVRLRVRVRGNDCLGSDFEEETFTQHASAQGGQILLSAPVTKGQRLTLSNEWTKASLECIVAHIGDTQNGQSQVGVSFTLPNPEFWNATFPPEERSTSHPDAKSKPGSR